MESEVAEWCETVTIADTYLAICCQLEVNILIDFLYFQKLWCNMSVGSDDAIATEIFVGRVVSESAAVILVALWFAPLA
jgi:hypothetical protein